MREYLALVLLATTLSACGSNSGESHDGAPAAERDSVAAKMRIERCVDRLLQRAASDANQADARRYARETYCARFESSGWIYDDGALSIRAQTWLDQSGTCATGREGEPTRTVPCDELDSSTRSLNCALLHHVRRDEVEEYIEHLQRNNPAIECDDGTRFEHLGVP